MKSFCEVWLDGRPFTGIDPALQALDVAQQMTMVFEREQKASRLGVLPDETADLDTEIRFLFKAHEADQARRGELLREVIAWADGHVLQTSTRPGLRMRVLFAGMEPFSTLRWTEELCLRFLPRGLPCWEDAHPRTVHLEGDHAEAEMIVPGSVVCPYVTAYVTAEEPLTRIRMTAGETAMTLEDFALPAGHALELDYAEDGHVLRIRDAAENRSLLPYLTPESFGALRLPKAGRGRIGLSADTPVSADFFARGLTL